MILVQDLEIDKSANNTETGLIVHLNLNGYIVAFIAMRHRTKEFYQKDFVLTHSFSVRIVGSIGAEDWSPKQTIQIKGKDDNIVEQLAYKLNHPKTAGEKRQKHHILEAIFTKKEWYS